MRLDVEMQPHNDPKLRPSKFLVPDGYTGWLLLEYGVANAEPVTRDDNMSVFRFSKNGMSMTSSSGPERGAEDEYFYYSPDGSTREIPRDYAEGKGMVWGQHEGTRNDALSQFGFFIGTEEQHKKYQGRATRPGPITTP